MTNPQAELDNARSLQYSLEKARDGLEKALVAQEKAFRVTQNRMADSIRLQKHWIDAVAQALAKIDPRSSLAQQLQVKHARLAAQLEQTQKQQRKLEQAWEHFQRKASLSRSQWGSLAPKGRFWLQGRETMLLEFERGQLFQTGSQARARHAAHDEATVQAEDELMKVLLPILPAILRKQRGKFSYKMGKLGEQVAAKILEERENNTIQAVITKSKGVDVQIGKYIAAEVKTTITDRPFADLLKSAYGGKKQCSDAWLRAVGIPDEDLPSLKVLGVQINPETEKFMVYERHDPSAETWNPLSTQWYDLKDFLDD